MSSRRAPVPPRACRASPSRARPVPPRSRAPPTTRCGSSATRRPTSLRWRWRSRSSALRARAEPSRRRSRSRYWKPCSERLQAVAEVAENTIVDGRYRITSRIGTGGMADVYCAHDEHLGRDVALKMLHRRFSQDQDFVERFRREASAAAGLQHPNVVNVFDRGQYDGTYYIAMEFLRGRTLKELILQEAPLDQMRALDMTVQTLRAAGFGHRRGVIHRDFKPQNVIVDDEDRVKVTDFGIA